jgi:hypothetical protein
MNKKTLKQIVLSISFIALISNATPLFAQLVELEILGGGYKIQGPSEIIFPTQTTSTSSSNNELSFSNIGASTPSQADNNYLMIIDENGGNPFDVTITTTELKRNETLQTTTIAGSTTTDLKVSNTTSFISGDTIELPDFAPSEIFMIDTVVDATTLTLESAMGSAPSTGEIVNRVVDCDITPKKCITLNNFYIKHGDTIDTIYGTSTDFSTNSETTNYTPFTGHTTTTTGSTGTTLKVNDANEFFLNESITFPSDSGVVPLTNVITTISDANTAILQTPFTVAPAADIIVESNSIRTLTIGNGTGYSPGQWKIYPYLQDTISAGQLPGTYETTLNFTIV